MQWDLYCRVVDNFGDIGVAWRLAADLAGRGESVRLAVDDASALAWMAPDGAAGVEVVGWHDGPSPAPGRRRRAVRRGPAAGARGRRRAAAPVLVNLEHLSAEPYVERSHGLPSPRRTPPASRRRRPGSSFPASREATGGLLREPGCVERRRAFGLATTGWRRSASRRAPDERRVSLFCYRNDAVPDAARCARRRADPAAARARAPPPSRSPPRSAPRCAAARCARCACRCSTQADFDRLLWSCELNFVRGEDSFVRAFWAGAPFVWQLYSQDDGAHAAKLDAFLDALPRRRAARPRRRAARAVRALERHRQRRAGAAACPSRPCARPGWRTAPAGATGWPAQDDLVTRLLRFVEAKR